MKGLDPILLVEDNDDDILLTRRAFKKINIDNELIIARNGLDAIKLIEENHLAGKVKYCLIIIDLQIPILNGKEVLQKIKGDKLIHTPIVVMSTSSVDDDVRECYELGANSFIKKPVDFKEFIEKLEVTLKYWLEINLRA